jgi:hypothetical protein
MRFACNCCECLAVPDCLISRPQDAMSLCLCIRILCEIKVHVFKLVIFTTMCFSEETRKLCRFRARVAFVTLFVGTSASFSHAPYCTFTLMFLSLYRNLYMFMYYVHICINLDPIYICIYRLCLSPCSLFAINFRFRPATTCFGFSFRRCCLTKASWLQSLQAKVIFAAVMIMPFFVMSAFLRRATRKTRHPSSSSRTIACLRSRPHAFICSGAGGQAADAQPLPMLLLVPQVACLRRLAVRIFMRSS